MTDVTQAPKPEPRIMRYDLSHFETAIKPMLPNKMFGSDVLVHRGATCRNLLDGIECWSGPWLDT